MPDTPHKYERVVFWSVEDDAFVVEVPELPGCMAHGATPAEALNHAEQAIDLWVETAQDLGREFPGRGIAPFINPNVANVSAG